MEKIRAVSEIICATYAHEVVWTVSRTVIHSRFCIRNETVQTQGLLAGSLGKGVGA